MIKDEEWLELCGFVVNSVTFWCAIIRDSEPDRILVGDDGVPLIWTSRHDVPSEIVRLAEERSSESVVIDLDSLSDRTRF